jgi:hypothetical protein
MGIASKLLVLLPLLVHDWYYMELLHGHHSQIACTTPFTDSRLVLYEVCCMGFARKIPVLLHLLVHD